MTAEELRTQLAQHIHGTHHVAELREHLEAVKKLLYKKSDKTLATYLAEQLPGEFSFVSTLLGTVPSAQDKEKLVALVEKTLASFKTVYLSLPYSPTGKQLAEYHVMLAKKISHPFILSVTTDPDMIGSVTWEGMGERHSKSLFETTKGSI